MIYNYTVRKVCEIDESNWEYFFKTQTWKTDESIVCDTHPTAETRDFVIYSKSECLPTCVPNSPTDLAIKTNVGNAIVDDEYSVTADLTNTKYIKVSLVSDDTTGDLEVAVFEKTTGTYGSVPSGKTWVMDLKEFTVPALGTVLSENYSWI